MGIKNFTKLIKKYAPKAIKSKKISDYKNKIIGIDSNLLIYKLVYAIRRNGYDLKNNDKIVTHVHALLAKLLAFRKYKITPIFVFDGFAPEIKYTALKQREIIKKKIIDKYKGSKTKEGKRIYYYVKSDITSQEIEDCKNLINIFNYPIIDAPEEADAQLAELSKNKIIDYIASDDTDILLFGGKKILKNFSIAENKNIEE